MTVTLFSVSTQLSFMGQSHKPCINKKVNLRHIVISNPIQSPVPVLFPTQGMALSVSETSI